MMSAVIFALAMISATRNSTCVSLELSRIGRGWSNVIPEGRGATPRLADRRFLVKPVFVQLEQTSSRTSLTWPGRGSLWVAEVDVQDRSTDATSPFLFKKRVKGSEGGIIITLKTATCTQCHAKPAKRESSGGEWEEHGESWPWPDAGGMLAFRRTVLQASTTNLVLPWAPKSSRYVRPFRHHTVFHGTRSVWRPVPSQG